MGNQAVRRCLAFEPDDFAGFRGGRNGLKIVVLEISFPFTARQIVILFLGKSREFVIETAFVLGGRRVATLAQILAHGR